RSRPCKESRQKDRHRLTAVATQFFLFTLYLVPAAAVAISLHEMGHGLAAYRLGDRSVRYFGYFTYDVRRFIDWIGVLAVFLAFTGWGRRIPIQQGKIDTL